MDTRRWEAIQAAFDELVSLDEANQATRIAALGDSDPELRAAVELLLVADADADARLAATEVLFRAPTCGPDLLGLTGRMVSHFRVLEPLGAGGMGVVYRAEDTRLGRTVALKFLLPHYGLDASAKERFLKEAHAAAVLDHLNLCTIYEVGESGEGQLFLAMALYSGETLKTRLAREGALPIREALTIARQIAEGLACAHAAGIVHRDLKPGNVMLMPNGPLKILDFGLAKALNESLSTASARMGTPSYMAPEQVQGEAVDARTDLWALGVVLYEMLTGKNPFDRDHDVAVAHAILVDEPLPLSTLRPEVSAAIEDLVLSLLQKDRANRHATADQLAARLAEIGTGIGPAVRSTGPPRSRVRHVNSGKRRWTLAVAAGGIGIVAVLVGAVLMLRRNGARGTESTSRVVVLPFENRSGVSELDPLGAMAAEWVTQGLTEAPFLTVLDTRGSQATGRALGTAAPTAVGRETGAGIVVEGSYFLQGDSLQLQARVASTADGSLLLVVTGVTTPRQRPLEGVEQVRLRVLAGLASLLDRDVTSFQANLPRPPTYAAYREYVRGLEIYMGGPSFQDAALHFLRAAVLDSTFLAPRIWAAQSSVLEWAMSMDAEWATRADSLINALQLLTAGLTPFERARLDFVVALRTGDLPGAYSATSRLVDASPGSIDARREAALAALRALRPGEALRRLEDLDPRRGLMRGWEVNYWLYVAHALHLLGRHEEELSAARRARQQDPSSPTTLYYELRALAALGRTSELDSVVRLELTASGQSGLIAFGVAGELMAHGHHEAALRLARYATEHLEAPPSTEAAAWEWLGRNVELHRIVGVPYCYLEEPPPQTSTVTEHAGEEWLHWRVELALLLGNTGSAESLAARLRDPGAHGLLIARILAANGKLDAARVALEQWETHVLHTRGSLRGLEIDRASVLVRLGDRERALEVLAEGIGRRPLANATTGWDGHAYPDLAPLWSDARFQALIKPRG